MSDNLTQIAEKAARIRKIASELGQKHPELPELDAIFVLAVGIRSLAFGPAGKRRVGA
jgi:hypothetical protein